MKKLTILTIILLLISSMFSTSYGAESTYLRARFTTSEVAGTNFKEITITPSRYLNGSTIRDDADDTYNIFLPSGYYVNGKSASFVADKDGKYPFTVYYANSKKTFIYTVKGIEEDTDSVSDDKKINFSYELMYDYEKMQVLFHMDIDKMRTVTWPGGTAVTNEVNYYINKSDDNSPYDLNIVINDESFSFKIVKQGEFYLLIKLSPVNYNNYSTLVEYHGYNFTSKENYTTFPAKDIYDDNGGYEVLVKSESGTSQSLFNFNINSIDYRRPNVDVDFLSNNTFHLEIQDDFSLAYMITFDGKYVPIKSSGVKSKFTYAHSTVIDYDGDYIFTVVDNAGNRTVKSVKIDSRKTLRIHKMNLEVHDYEHTNDLFQSKGIIYEKISDDLTYYENILPAYMNGSNSNFNPDSPITRAEMITVFCRLNNLAYDTNAYLKTKFTDIENHWARDYISMGSSKKYISGYKDKTFKPDSYVTRAEFCQMLTKISAYKTKLNELPASNNYEFNDISAHWAEKEIIKISSRDLVTSSDNYFYPDNAITRAEVVHAINKLYGFNPSNIELNYTKSLYSKYYNFSDIENHKYYNDIIISVVGMYKEKIKK